MELAELNSHRFQHRYIIGKTGTGKTTTLLNAAIQDIQAGHGVLFIDPHGSDSETLLNYVPRDRRKDVILFDPTDDAYPIPINVLDGVPPRQIPTVASSIVDTFKALWGYHDLPTPVLEQYLYNTAAALMEYRHGTLLGIKLMLTSPRYRHRVLKQVSDPIIRDFWLNDFFALSAREKRETTQSTLNKIGMLIADARIRQIVGYHRSCVSMDDVLQGKVFVARLPQGDLGLKKTQTLGALLLAQLHAAALRRTTFEPFHIYVDECHHFATATLVEMLSGIRKFQVSLTLSNQYLDQLSEEMASAVLGAVGTIVAYRVGHKDARMLDDELRVNSMHRTLAELPPYVARIANPAGVWERAPMPTLPPPLVHDGFARAQAFTRRHIAKPRDKVVRYIDRVMEDAHARGF